MKRVARRVARLGAALLIGLALAGCASAPPEGAVRLDGTPRLAVVSAFPAELALLRNRLQQPASYRVNGVDFSTGTLEGKPVVLFLSGVSMTNAAMNTQLVLDRFAVSGIVFSGIAGGVNPALHIGDVTVPAQWGQYLEVLMARETAPGQYSPRPSRDAVRLPNFGMMYPGTVNVRSAAGGAERKFWFEVDPTMLAAARNIAGVELALCDTARRCLDTRPKLVIGGNGVSGPAFVDNAAFREYTFNTFQANVLDMETAAVGMVAYANGVPYIAFRSLSDLAGGGQGENEMRTFMNIAADNAAKVLLAFLAAWK